MGLDHAREFGDDLDPKGCLVLGSGIQDLGNLIQVPAQGKQLLIGPGQSLQFRLSDLRLVVHGIGVWHGHEPARQSEAYDALRGWGLLRGWFSFVAACSIGGLANVGIATWLFQREGGWVVPAIAGVLVGAVWLGLAAANAISAPIATTNCTTLWSTDFATDQATIESTIKSTQ